MNNLNIFIFIIIVLICYIFFITYRLEKLEKCKKIETFADSSLTSEQLANIASLYNSGDFKVTNLTVTGKTKFMDEVEFDKKTTYNNEAIFQKKSVFNDISEFNKDVKFKQSTHHYGPINANVNNGIRFTSNGKKHQISMIDKELAFSVGNENENLDNNKDKRILTLPESTNNIPVFRANGLAYTNKNFPTNIDMKRLSSRDVMKFRNQINKDEDRKNNFIYLGGMTRDNDNRFRIVGGVRKHMEHGDFFFETINDHGPNWRLCNNGVNQCKFHDNNSIVS